MDITKSPSLHYLFGRPKPWLPSDWTSSDDRVRGGSSISYLLISSQSYSPISTGDAADTVHPSSATFTGHLDTQTLGGAGFASQRTTSPNLALDLRPYDAGLELAITKSDGKTYTLILKDELPVPADGREQSSLSWEAEVKPLVAGEKIRVRWAEFKAMYRGREREGAGHLNRGEVKRVGIMCRSHFGEQEGDFELVIGYIAAIKSDDEVGVRYRDDPNTDSFAEKQTSTVPVRQGWLDWIVGKCLKL